MLTKILSEHHCLIDTQIKSKKAALEKLSHLLGRGLAHIDGRDILCGLSERERLGSTAIGHGVALPHARLKYINSPIAAFIKLSQPIEFNDDMPVDLVFALLVPEDNQSIHLQLLAEVASIFSEASHREAIRNAKDHSQLWKCLLTCNAEACDSYA
jgi:PTS system nitrogen regulatory IIA component